jgi:D-glycero-alpha-D-manno-heptose-7-phosphate kinase
VSFFGGGTDYPDWIREHGGAVLGMAVNKYCYITARRLPPFFGHKHRIVYSVIEAVQEIAEIKHPAVRAGFSEMGVTQGLEIHHNGDLPARSGLGSSSSFTVGLLNTLYALQGRIRTKAALAAEATRIEQEVIGESVGSQDQLWAAYGGLNLIDFGRDREVSVKQLILSAARRRELVGSLLLVFSGLSRFASEVAQQKIDNLSHNEHQLLALRQMVDDAMELLVDDREPIHRIGELMHESWMLKRGLATTVTNDRVDEIYQAAMAAGAAGGKLLGAGGGGFLAFIMPAERRAAVCNALRGLIQVSVDIDPDGSRIMVYEPNDVDEPDDNEPLASLLPTRLVDRRLRPGRGSR